jgi:toxin FitB
MFILDTNVVSELRKKQKGDPAVSRWIEQQSADTLYLSAMTIQELYVGALLLRRKNAAAGQLLLDWIEDYIVPTFDSRILSIDTPVAKACAALHVPVTRPGHDSLIAATALTHRMTVVTRDVSDFAPMGVRTINPWEYRG